MNKITTLAAISMFAVIMGFGVIAPALAAPQGNNGNADVAVCHYDVVEDNLETEDIDESLESAWIVLYVNSQGQMNGHTNHGDKLIGDVDGDTTITVDSCLAQDPPVTE